MPPPEVYGFTATRTLRNNHCQMIDDQLVCLTDGDQYITGGAFGGDTYIAYKLLELYPDARHTLIVPDYHHNTFLELDFKARGHEVIQSGTTKQRNQEIVDRCTTLCGFPLYTEERMPRSGTWQTIRMGRRAGRPVRLLVLSP